ncbi:MAG: hypothetical protein GKC10_01050 [Methanosarcinales archaeon]|nr:hypothetical protein [Methanosarcinales archaeon]
MRTRFNLTRSPDLRSCFLKQLLLKDVNLEPSGWRRGLALGFELKDNGFGEVEAEQILAQASGQAERSRRLMEAVYRRMKGPQGAWTCLQLKDLEMICSNCVSQFKAAPRESITEICSDGGQQEMPRQSGRELAIRIAGLKK